MNLHPIDLTIIIIYFLINAGIGLWVQKRATKEVDSFFLADRNVPWWMLGLSGCSSYIDIGGTMALVGAMFYLGVKSIWMTHIFWGWMIISFYMAFQAKYIRRSGVMTFAEWNGTRFGATRDAEGRVTGITQVAAAAAERDGRMQATVANTLFGVGGALAAAGVVLVIIGPSSEPTVALGPTAGGVMISGQF